MKKTTLIVSLFSLMLLVGCSAKAPEASENTQESNTVNLEQTNTLADESNETNENYESEYQSPEEDKTTEESVTSTSTTTSPITEDTKNTETTKTYTLAEVAKHASETDCRTTINGNVYNITSYVTRHPGGVKQIMRVCGTDGTQAFSRKHDGDTKPKDILAGFKIGTLAQ